MPDEIMAVVRRPDGAWSDPEVLSVNQGIAGSPVVTAAGGGRAYAAWIANGDDGVYYSMFQAPACADSVDNDEDGLIDHPADPGCSSSADDDESDPPADDGDGGGGDDGGGTTGGSSDQVDKSGRNDDRSGNNRRGTAAAACRKASIRVARTTKQFKKARGSLNRIKRHARKAKGRAARRQARKAGVRVKKLHSKRKRMARAKRVVCGRGSNARSRA